MFLKLLVKSSLPKQTLSQVSLSPPVSVKVSAQFDISSSMFSYAFRCLGLCDMRYYVGNSATLSQLSTEQKVEKWAFQPDW